MTANFAGAMTRFRLFEANSVWGQMPALAKRYMAPEEYLQIERCAAFRSEYFQGGMVAMAGAGRLNTTA